jgi:hypothetical protein
LINPSPGFTVGNNNQQSNNLFAFDEKANAPLLINVTAEFGGALTAGTRYNSHYVFFDPGPSRRAIGSVRFDDNIVAVFTSRTTDLATDPSFGKPGVNYLSPTNRGLESGDTISVIGNQLNIDWTASNPGDYVRVLTLARAVPEPASWALMLTGFGIVGAAARRRANARMSFS